MSQTELLQLVDEAGFIFKGKVIGKNTGDRSLASSTQSQSVTVEVEDILFSAPVLSSFAGKQATVITKATGGEVGSEFFFFTKVLVLSDQLTVSELGRITVSRAVADEVAHAVRDAAERPLRERVAGAEMIVVGHVISSQRVEVPEIRRSEHDPEWWIAEVAVDAVLKGERNREEIKVLFANSMDIAWYLSPKLHKGVSGVLLLRRVEDADELPKAVRAMYAATHPLDLLPMERLPDVERMVGRKEGRG